MPNVHSPMAFYKLRYEYTSPKQTQTTHTAKMPLHTNTASEVQAKDELDSFLQDNCPEAKRLLVTGSLSAGEEILVVNPQVAKKLEKTRTKPEQPLQLLDTDAFIGETFKNALSQAKEIKIQHHNGKLINSRDIQEDLNPFLQALRNDSAQPQSHSLKKTKPAKSKLRFTLSEADLPVASSKKPGPGQPKAMSTSAIDDTESEAESDEVLMFKLEL